MPNPEARKSVVVGIIAKDSAINTSTITVPTGADSGARGDDLLGSIAVGGIGRHGRDGPKTYTYWMASWCEDGKMSHLPREHQEAGC